MHAARFQNVSFLSRSLGKTDVPRDRTVQPTRLCGTSPFYVYVFLIFVFVWISFMTVVVWGVIIGHDLAVLLPGQS